MFSHPLNRRYFLQATVAAGAASIFSPLRANAAAQLRERFRNRFERPRVPLDPIRVDRLSVNGLVRERITIATESGVRTPVLSVFREGARSRPSVVALHGLGGSKESLLGFLEPLAHLGFVAVAIDARYHGDRAGDLQAAMIRSFQTGQEHPYIWDTVWDTWRTLDYLQTRPEVDGARLGVMGISLGGHATWMASADNRVSVAVPCISVCSWRWELQHQGYQQRVQNVRGAFEGVLKAMGEKTITPQVVAAAWDRWTPGVPSHFDCQDLLAAFAPRPLLIAGGDEDPVAPIEGARIAFSAIAPAYRRHPDHLQISIAPHSGHTVTADQSQQIIAWFQKWLTA